jgi:hypothetical protein
MLRSLEILMSALRASSGPQRRWAMMMPVAWPMIVGDSAASCSWAITSSWLSR